MLRIICILACILVGTVFLPGCSNTEMVSSWRNPQLAGYQQILAIGISENAATRRIFEDAFAAQAQAAGVNVTPSYSILPESGQIPNERIGEAVRKTGADAVLIMRLLDIDRQIYAVPGRYTYGAYPAYGYYEWAWRGYYEPPQLYERVSVILETNIYDAATGDLAWSGKTRTIDPSNLDNEMNELSRLLVREMRASDVIGGARIRPAATRPQ